MAPFSLIRLNLPLQTNKTWNRCSICSNCLEAIKKALHTWTYLSLRIISHGKLKWMRGLRMAALWARCSKSHLYHKVPAKSWNKRRTWLGSLVADSLIDLYTNDYIKPPWLSSKSVAIKARATRIVGPTQTPLLNKKIRSIWAIGPRSAASNPLHASHLCQWVSAKQTHRRTSQYHKKAPHNSLKELVQTTANVSIVEASKSVKSERISSGMREASSFAPRSISILSNLKLTSLVKVSKQVGRRQLKNS